MPTNEVRRSVRLWVPSAIFVAFAMVIAYQLIDIQVLHHGRYEADAASELIESDAIYARRGSILDRNGNPLALSVDTWDLYVSKRAWKDDEIAQEAATQLQDLVGTPAADLISTVQQSESVDVLIRRDIEYDHGLVILDEGIDGVILLRNTKRVHPEGDVGASILGFTGADNEGLVGLEAYYDSLLRGEPGRVLYERDTTGEPIPYGMRLREAPEPGADIVLTIDRYLQELAESTLQKAIADHEAKGGTIIIMDPNSGELLALASNPTFTYSNLDLSDPEQAELLRNRAISDLYEPGSVMKVVTAASAVDAGVVNENTTYEDTGVTRIGDTEIRNWDYNVYGLQTMTGVLEYSINTGAVFMAQLLGAERFHDYIAAFGFGQPTGIDFPGEAEGLFRRPWDEGWTAVDLATQSFGQAISVTPIQMTNAIAATINGGRLLTPHFLQATVRDGAVNKTDLEVRSNPITPESSATLRGMLEAVLDVPGGGPGGRHVAAPPHYNAGGKSGTSSVPVPNGYDETVTASFVGFAPVDDPKVLVLVKIDENQDLETGTQAAGPVVGELLEKTLRYLNTPPDVAEDPGQP